ncbi:hydroxymethylglutaryl-CoA lyase [Agrobacterium pusense]|uniref:hydroxymethylglutaryl-CoA lyase n=1 Tax=Agrobacterium pusense TaxID=648995 RepID=UPI001C6EBFD5|nr:hydroxymethylglutaryl-CoA lyase [Agrobacterium pusense]MBW9070112.1 hydroxymethylglutaryl-CoA lyase [Agrobacterium pusense]MBW9085048.1 hydroxymethylglutaryl-CoA lyase [Agrobacterium pusense]MBW9125477.1 hydroxymethylglutaryl-CoA lyase [Agrobacterium pusense]MBW9137892.1 hydroxymethylglutaryl-CoA lyase [Agrobacterium pusense]
MDNIRIVEVGPRDGLQNEARPLGVVERVQMIEGLIDAGLKTIEVGSFVSPKWVPQMAGSAEVLTTLGRREGVTFQMLVPNMKGFEAARAAGTEEIAIFASASESFSQKNINCSIEESFSRFAPVLEGAREAGMRVRGYVSCVLGCPYEGGVSLHSVVSVARRLYDLGCYEVSLGDTIGTGTPKAAAAMVRAAAGEMPITAVAIHEHNTYGQALANILACLEAGVTTFDASVGGLGGCPYANGATGNVATEELVYMLEGMGVSTSIDLPKLSKVAASVSNQLGRDNPTSFDFWPSKWATT